MKPTTPREDLQWAVLIALIALLILVCPLRPAHGAALPPPPPAPALPALPAAPKILREQSLSMSALPTLVPVSGTRYKFANGTLNYVGDGLKPLPSDVEYVFAPGSTIVAKLNKDFQEVFAIPAGSSRVAIRNVSLKTNNIIAIDVQGDDVTLDSIADADGQLYGLRNVNRILITNCISGILPNYWGYLDWAGDGNYDVTISHCTVGGDLINHCLRAYGSHRVLVDTCTFSNPANLPNSQHGECMKICDGSDWTVRGCKFDGPLQIGANYQLHSQGNKPGKIDGVFYAAGEKVCPIVKDIRFENCDQKGGNVRLQPGVINFTWSGGSIQSLASSVFTVRANHEFPDRPIVSGYLEKLAATTPTTRGTLFVNGWPGGVHIGAGVTVNGQTQPQK